MCKVLPDNDDNDNDNENVCVTPGTFEVHHSNSLAFISSLRLLQNECTHQIHSKIGAGSVRTADANTSIHKVVLSARLRCTLTLKAILFVLLFHRPFCIDYYLHAEQEQDSHFIAHNCVLFVCVHS